MKNSDAQVSPIFLQGGLTHNSHVELGLTKREYFAAMAMQGILSNSKMMEAYTQNTDGKRLVVVVAEDAILHADELLKQLEK